MQNFTGTEGANLSEINTTAVVEVNVTPKSSTRGLDDIAISYIVIVVVGMIGNSFSAFILLKFKKKNFFHLLLVNQCFIDVAAAALLVALSSNTYDSTGNFGLSGKIYCFIWNNKVILWSLFLCSTLNLVVLNLERYMEVVFPLFHKTSLKRYHVYIVIGIVWLAGFVYNLAYKIPTSYVEDGKCLHMRKWPSKAVQRFGGVLNALLYFFLPFIIMVLVTIAIIRVLKERTKVTNSNSVSSQSDKAARTHRNVSLTLAIVVLCFLLCWIWNQVFFLLFNLGYITSLKGWFYHFTVYAAFINCCINPFIYAAQYKEFQVKAKRLLCRYKVGDLGKTSTYSTNGKHLTVQATNR